MSWVIGHSPHGGSELLCLLMVANHARADGTGAFPSVPMLAQECRMSSRQVIRLLHRLEQSGALRIERGAGPRGTHLMSVVLDDHTPKVASTPDILSPPTTDKMSPPDKMSPDKTARGGDIAMSPEPSLEPSLDTHSPTESGASAMQTPPPKPRGHPKVTVMIDALRGEGMTGTLTAKDRAAIQRTEHDAGEVAALYAAIFRGEYGDDFMHDNLSVWLCLEKLPGWLSHRAGHHAPARKNGKPLRGGAAIDALWEEAHGQDRGGSRGPAVGHEEAGGGVPRQLRG